MCDSIKPEENFHASSKGELGTTVSIPAGESRPIPTGGAGVYRNLSITSNNNTQGILVIFMPNGASLTTNLPYYIPPIPVNPTVYNHIQFNSAITICFNCGSSNIDVEIS